MKTFYTVRDIEDMFAAGVREIETHDDVVVTDVAREKAIALGMRLKPLDAPPAGRPGSAPPRPAAAPAAAAPRHAPAGAAGDPSGDLVRQIKAAVVARLGTDKYNDLLDQIIPNAIAQLKK